VSFHPRPQWELPHGAGLDEAIAVAVANTGDGFALSTSQELAVKAALQNKVTVVTGGAGVGKTKVCLPSGFASCLFLVLLSFDEPKSRASGMRCHSGTLQNVACVTPARYACGQWEMKWGGAPATRVLMVTSRSYPCPKVLDVLARILSHAVIPIHIDPNGKLSGSSFFLLC
jgi:hypothetical protein